MLKPLTCMFDTCGDKREKQVKDGGNLLEEIFFLVFSTWKLQASSGSRKSQKKKKVWVAKKMEEEKKITMTETWLRKHRLLYVGATRHPFIHSIRDGNVDFSSFKTWLVFNYSSSNYKIRYIFLVILIYNLFFLDQLLTT